jgi:hypothetical protein
MGRPFVEFLKHWILMKFVSQVYTKKSVNKFNFDPYQCNIAILFLIHLMAQY